MGRLEELMPGKIGMAKAGDAEGFIKENGKIAFQTIVIALLLMGISAVSGYWQVAVGIGCGFVIGIINYLVMAKVIDRGLTVQENGSQAGAFFTLIGHVLRFWVLAGFLYFIFQQFGARFGLSLVLGMSLIKWTTFMEILQNSLTDSIYPANVKPQKKYKL